MAFLLSLFVAVSGCAPSESRQTGSAGTSSTRGSACAMSTKRDVSGPRALGHSGDVSAQARWDSARADAKKATQVFMATNGRLKSKIEQKDLDYFKTAYGERMAKDPFFANAFGLTFGANNTLRLASLASTTSHFSEDSAREVRAILGSSLILTAGGLRNGLDADGRNLWNAWNAGLDEIKYDFDTSLKQQRARYLDGLNKLGPSYWNGKEASAKGPGKPGYYLISGMIADAAKSCAHLGLGDAFLNGKHAIADDIVSWDYKHPGPFAPPNVEYRPPLTKTWDPIQNMLVGMGGNAAASRTFLATEAPFAVKNTVDQPTSLVRYLVGHRRVLPYQSENEMFYLDYGNALGEIIDEASSDTRQPQSPYVVREFLQGYTDGLSQSDAEHEGQDRFGYFNRGLREKSGDILKEYGSDLASEMSGPTGVAGATEGSSGKKGDYHLALTQNLAMSMHKADSDFFKDIAFSKKAKSTLIDSLKRGFEKDLEAAYRKNKGSLSSEDIKYGIKILKTRYINIFNTIDTESLAADLYVTEDGSLSDLNIISLQTITQGAGSFPEDQIGGMLVDAKLGGNGPASSESNEDEIKVCERLLRRRTRLSSNVDNAEVKAMTRIIVNEHDTSYKNQAIEFNRKVTDSNRRFMDEQGNWLVGINPKTGVVTGDDARVQQYINFVKKDWKP